MKKKGGNLVCVSRCGLILAGGHSCRMGSDKAALSVQGRTLLDHAIAFWRSCEMEHIYVSLHNKANVTLPQDVTPIYDVLPNRGPMGGLYSAFRTTNAPLLWVSGVDMPFLRSDALLPEPEGDAAVYRINGKPQPLFAVYRRSILPFLEQMLQDGDGRMMELLRRVDTQWIDAPEQLSPMFENWNSPEDILRSLAGTPPILTAAAWSGTGKTTFLEQLLPALNRRGLRVAMVKHSHHPVQPEQPNKDTARLRQAGAAEVLLWTEDFAPDRIRAQLSSADLILMEGFKSAPIPKLVLHRSGTPSYFPEESTVIAHITDTPLPSSRPQMGWEEAERCAKLVCSLFGIKKEV